MRDATLGCGTAGGHWLCGLERAWWHVGGHRSTVHGRLIAAAARSTRQCRPRSHGLLLLRHLHGDAGYAALLCWAAPACCAPGKTKVFRENRALLQAMTAPPSNASLCKPPQCAQGPHVFDSCRMRRMRTVPWGRAHSPRKIVTPCVRSCTSNASFVRCAGIVSLNRNRCPSGVHVSCGLSYHVAQHEACAEGQCIPANHSANNRRRAAARCCKKTKSKYSTAMAPYLFSGASATARVVLAGRALCYRM